MEHKTGLYIMYIVSSFLIFVAGAIFTIFEPPEFLSWIVAIYGVIAGLYAFAYKEKKNWLYYLGLIGFGGNIILLIVYAGFLLA